MKKILLIEDNQYVRENTAEILELENYDVFTAENGKVGIEMALKHIPDIIICDIMMPELDGYDVFEGLSTNPKTASIPFIYLTAKSEKAEIRKGMNLGADDYLTKPFEEYELLQVIVCRLKKNDFLKKEFSKNIQGISTFLNEASKYLNLTALSKDRALQSYKNKEEIYREGSAAQRLYFIQSGNVKTFKTIETGKEFVTGFYSAGDFIGQLSLLGDSGKYTETATALEKAEICAIPKVDFITLLYQNKYVSNKFISMISNNMIDLQKQLINMAFATVRQKTAKALLALDAKGMMKDKNHTGISIPREDFAGLIGTATETAIRMLSQFKEEELIGIASSKKLILLDKNKLQHIADFLS
ncbi:MAG: CheY-like chemotaxis protein/CRP-like cAMP-binding protein [Polaribacter sp.]|jgi:CheY-like chemotaxis protein/CRP-like cAMP-binding protein